MLAPLRTVERAASPASQTRPASASPAAPHWRHRAAPPAASSSRRALGSARPAARPGRMPDPLQRRMPAQPQGSARKITSVLFGDLVGFTTLSESRDPEEVREMLTAYFEECRAVVDQYGGELEKFIGDAVMAVWGLPITREDDAERAVRAGLELVERSPRWVTASTCPAGHARRHHHRRGRGHPRREWPGHGRRRPRQHGGQDPVDREPGEVWIDDTTRTSRPRRSPTTMSARTR